jgi:uncharacterized phage protein (predicted DNA packaging)
MAGLPDITTVKLHLRVTDSSEDSLIQIYMDAAERYVRETLGSDIPGEMDSPASIPANISAAYLLTVGDLYENRAGQSSLEIRENPAVMRLLNIDRKGLGV